MVPLPFLPQPIFWIAGVNQQGQQPCPSGCKLQFGLTGMTPTIFFCSWPMLKNSKRPSEILTRYAPLCSIEYHWRDSSVHKTTEPFNLQRAAFKGYTSESKHWLTFWSKRWFHSNCNSCMRGHNMAILPAVYSSAGVILVMPPVNLSQAITWTDQLTRKWWQQPATINMMMKCRDSMLALGTFPCCQFDEAPRQGTCCWLLSYWALWHTENHISCSNNSAIT